MVLGANHSPIISPKTRVIAIIGNPITHSLSPKMQNAAFAASALDYIYLPFAVSPYNLERAVLGMKALGFHGFNVTIPHKSTIIPFLDRVDATAEAAGAVNTVLLSETGLTGFNTDGDGLVASLFNDLEFVPGDEQILVLGAGGASRGGVAALCRSGAKKIIICNRSLNNAQKVMTDMVARYPKTHISIIDQNHLTKEYLELTSLIINTTSIGMKGEAFEGLDLSLLPKYAKVYDMVYSASGTPLINNANNLGLRGANGLGMLVAQGEVAFNIWTGQKAPEGIMRKALENI